MENAIAIHVDLPKPVAEAWLDSLRCELKRAVQTHWYEDRYRYVPEQLRTRRILDDNPGLVGHKHTIGALKAALNDHQ